MITLTSRRKIRKVAVLGSGIMGSRIACHFANIGIEVLLLDILPKDGGVVNKNKTFRNSIADQALLKTIKSTPNPLYDPSNVALITTGNFEDHLALISQVDWVVEAVIENLKIKKELFYQVEKHRKKGTLITTNTSGIPIQLMAENRSEDFQRHFCGTHFFNPPRYLRLLEIIPSTYTDTKVMEFLMYFGRLHIGKETVLCKDTPAFIANRIGIFSMMSILHLTQEMGLSVSEVDRLTGTIIGNAKSATYRTTDIVGLDTIAHVANNLYEQLKTDERREVFILPPWVKKLLEKNLLGEKTGQGFYKKIKVDGNTEIKELDLKTLKYCHPSRSNFEVLDKVKNIENIKKRLPMLLQDPGRVGTFYKRMFFELFAYSSHRIPEVTEELYKIDQAVVAGFERMLGPFECWDALGLPQITNKMKEEGYLPANWVVEMIDHGIHSFYCFKDGAKHYYDIKTNSYQPIDKKNTLIILDAFKENNIVWKNEGSTVYNIGEGVLNLEFHTKMNTIDAEVIEGINTAITLAEKEFIGLVIGNESLHFSAGANLTTLLTNAVEQKFDKIDEAVSIFQNTMTRARFSNVPVIAALSGMVLGGGCELSLHCDLLQAYAESYIGLVELGVGLIPAGGGTKELVLRASDNYTLGNIELNTLQNFFMTIATAKVSTSAEEAKKMCILRKEDKLTMNRKKLLTDAKKQVITLSEMGYKQPLQRKNIKVQGSAALAMLHAGINMIKYGDYISEYDVKIAKKLAFVMSGGDLSAPTEVSEKYLLDLEREAFLSLCGEPKTQDRMRSILFKGKPLRN